MIGQSVELVNDTDTVNEDATVTVADGADEDLLIDDFGVSSVTHIQHTSGTDGNVTYSLMVQSTSVTGTYGTLTIGADGSYVYLT